MKRNLLLILGVFVAILLIVNGAKRLLAFRTTSQKVEEAQMRLDALKKEKEVLKMQAEYTKSQDFKEKEIRDKLGLAKEGETVVILPKDVGELSTDAISAEQLPNYVKWWNLFFRT